MKINSTKYRELMLDQRFPCTHAHQEKKLNDKKTDQNEQINKAFNKPIVTFISLILIFWLCTLIPNFLQIFLRYSDEQTHFATLILKPRFTSLSFENCLTFSGVILPTVAIWYAVKEVVINTANHNRKEANKAKEEFFKLVIPTLQISGTSFSIKKNKINQKILEEKEQKFTRNFKKLNAIPAWSFQIIIVCSAAILLYRILYPSGNSANTCEILTNGQKVVLTLIVFLHYGLFSFIHADMNHIFLLNKKRTWMGKPKKLFTFL